MTPKTFRNNAPTTRKAGFSLIELMVTVAIIGILAAIAYPAYTQYVVRSNRSTAQGHLLDIAQQQQQYLIDNRAYAGAVADLNGMTTPGSVSKYYTITIVANGGPPPTFTITASPRAGTSQAGDGDLTINNTGTKTPADKW